MRANEVIPLFLSGFVSLFIVALIVLIVLAVKGYRRERRRRAELDLYATQLGWQPIAGPVPEPVAKDVRSRRNKLALSTQRGPHPLWLVWHQWTESNGETSTTTRNLTRYYIWLGQGHPDIQLRRRSRIGAFFKPVRGVGTGDAAFDRAFLVRPSGTYEHQRLLTPQLRAAMVARQVPAWRITGGVLIIGYGDVPRIENLQPRADVICYLAQALG